MARKSERYPALYERLSHDDELQGESDSISNQKRGPGGLCGTARVLPTVFTSPTMASPAPGLTGLVSEKMIDEVKANQISVVIVKDMSRFGRDYLQVGTYMEVLRKHDTRLIALNDSVDTLKGDDEFTPFRSYEPVVCPRYQQENPLCISGKEPCWKAYQQLCTLWVPEIGAG